MPSHGMIMMINDTVYNITGLYYNTNYTITVYATNDTHGDGEPATVTVKTKSLPPGTYKILMYKNQYLPTYIGRSMYIRTYVATV